MALDTKSFKPVDLPLDELLEMRKEVYDKVVVARVGLLLRHP